MAVSIFVRAAEGTTVERDVMKAIPEPELIQQMMAKVKLSAPNLERTKQAGRRRGGGGSSGGPAGADSW